MKEKRTDVVKRYEEEIERLNTLTSTLNEKIAALTAEKVKNEARLTELQGRVDVAEGELKERDQRCVRFCSSTVTVHCALLMHLCPSNLFYDRFLFIMTVQGAARTGREGREGPTEGADFQAARPDCSEGEGRHCRLGRRRCQR